MNAALTGAFLFGPGLNNLTENTSIVPQDQALTNQYYLQRALGVQQAAIAEDTGAGSASQQGSGESQILLIPIVFVSAMCVFSVCMVMMTMMMMRSNGTG